MATQKTAWLQVRVTEKEKSEVQSAAAKKGQNMSQWALRHLLREARKVNRK